MRISAALLAMGLMLALGSLATALDHPRPGDDALVPLSGWPFYVENLTVGTPISDFGSHAGIKATADDDYPPDNALYVPAGALLNSAHYAAYTDKSGQIDQFFVRLAQEGQPSPDRFFPYDRSIDFVPWGFSESGSDGDLRVEGTVLTLDTDLFGYGLKVFNDGSQAATLTVDLVWQRDGDRADESLHLRRIRASYAHSIDQSEGLFRFAVDFDIWRVVRADFALATAQTTDKRKRLTLSADPIVIEPGRQATLAWIVAFGRSEADAVELARSLDPFNPDAHWASAENLWANRMAALPAVHATGAEDQTLAQVAAAGLWMNVYAPRNAMTERCSVPAKAHFNSFWGWDTAFQSMGQAYLEPELARENLTTLFSGPEPRAYLELGDDLLPAFPARFTQPPVAPWAAWDVYTKTGAVDKSWLSSMYVAGRAYLAWLEQEKDIDGDGLLEFSSGLECGWDDSPRYHCNLAISMCIEWIDYIDSLTLNSWMVADYLAMARMAQVVAPSQADFWRRRAVELGQRIEQTMWSEPMSAYFDRESDGYDHRLHHVLTPAIAWPLFAGITRDPQRARTLIEGHLLKRDEFWGDEQQMPFPTVAFSDLAYDDAQDGYYWEGQVWMITSYAMIVALYRYGYEAQADEAARRTLDMIRANDPGGIYEAYDAKTGRTGFSTNGRLWGAPGEPAAFQFGWSCTFVLEMLYQRYQRERFVMPEDTALTGHLAEAQEIRTGQPFFLVDQPGMELPLTRIDCQDGRPLLEGCGQIAARFEDPWGALGDRRFTVRFPTAEPDGVTFHYDDGTPGPVHSVPTDRGAAFAVTVGQGGTFTLMLDGDQDDEDETDSDQDDGGCCG